MKIGKTRISAFAHMVLKFGLSP